MRTSLQRDYRFEAAHFLPHVPAGHKCSRMHGHSYAVTVTIEGEVGLETGWVMDFAAIDEVISPIVRQLDHRILNEIDGLANPTSEVFAAWLWSRIVGLLPGVAEVTVSETKSSRCSYRGSGDKA
jgi:6-pyruvoyltetrahydropterin/6-carboxytetrahydropterin synthase